ncbi:hypothetical protein [Cryobacterium gelidum]|nr:hypothetical protein [Cryobacterium gelidum]
MIASRVDLWLDARHPDDAEAGARSLALVLADFLIHAREETRELCDRTRR